LWDHDPLTLTVYISTSLTKSSSLTTLKHAALPLCRNT
jgi:hypothetical protein